MSLITLITDFGTCDGYVGVMRGVMAQIAAGVAVVDLTHEVPPQDVMAARFIAMNSYRYFPEGTVHCIVVDPGVGTCRRAIALEADVNGVTQYFVAPDNGVLDGVIADLGGMVGRVVSLTSAAYWRTPQPSRTFHGRDIFAPVAAHLAGGTDLAQLGAVIPVDSLVRLSLGCAIATSKGIQGVVQYIDHFGNAITNIPEGQAGPQNWQVIVQGQACHQYVSYGDASPGELLALIGSHGWVELAVNGGSAADRLGLRVGDSVLLTEC